MPSKAPKSKWYEAVVEVERQYRAAKKTWKGLSPEFKSVAPKCLEVKPPLGGEYDCKNGTIEKKYGTKEKKKASWAKDATGANGVQGQDGRRLQRPRNP